MTQEQKEQIRRKSVPAWPRPNPSTHVASDEVETVFVGGPLHGLHMQDTTKELRILEHEGKEYLYSRMPVDDDTPNRVVYVLMNRSPQTAG